jgi:hypothetical protein
LEMTVLLFWFLFTIIAIYGGHFISYNNKIS